MRKRRLNKKGYVLVVTICAIVCGMGCQSLFRMQGMAGWLRDQVWLKQMPLIAFASSSGGYKGEWDPFILNHYLASNMSGEIAVEDAHTYQKILLEEARGENLVAENGNVIIYNEILEEEELLQAQVIPENIVDNATSEFTTSAEKAYVYEISKFHDLDTLVKEFYVVDAQTQVDEKLLNVESLLGQDMTLKGDVSQPQILVYHTHSQEAFVDSIPGDQTTTIVGAGDELVRILEEEYGYNVIHDRTEYDLESRDEAYTLAEPSLEAILEEHPSIEVMIDLHRDATMEHKQFLANVNGTEMAQVMFFNGLSRTKEYGEIAYLPNPNLSENLAFSFQMQKACNEYYEGFTRKIYLKGYRYNLHFRGKSLLIELGAQTNTVEQIKNACAPIAHALHMVLSGEEP